MPIQGIKINIKTIQKICRNFPKMAEVKVSELSIGDIHVILMIDNCSNGTFQKEVKSDRRKNNVFIL